MPGGPLAQCARFGFRGNPIQQQKHYVNELCQSVLQFFRNIAALPRTIEKAALRRRLQSTRDANEAERLDRIRNPSKYLGK
jgi:hypothetical protein